MIVITVVQKKHDLSTDLGLQASSGLDLRKHKTIRKNTAGLLPEAYDGFAH